MRVRKGTQEEHTPHDYARGPKMKWDRRMGVAWPAEPDCWEGDEGGDGGLGVDSQVRFRCLGTVVRRPLLWTSYWTAKSRPLLSGR